MLKIIFQKNAFFLLIAIAATWGCSADPKSPTAGGGSPPDPNASFSRVQMEIFTPHCAVEGCHAPPTQQGLDLRDGHAYDNVVGVPAKESAKVRIAPGHPEDSYLVDKIRGAAGIDGARMPASGPPYLTDQQIQLIVDWVRRGAPKD